MSFMPQKLGRALTYSLLIWASGFAWGTLIFMVPVLRDAKPIPYISSNPFISFPIIILWILLARKLTKSYLTGCTPDANEGLKLGMSFLAVNFLLDVLVLVMAFGNGPQYYLSLSVWSAYTVLIFVPVRVNRSRSSVLQT